MKLIKIKIVNFGQFSNFTIDLPNSDIDVFYGANEAGKSTIVAFIKQVMFGFHLAKHSSAFFEDYKPLARVSPMGGSLFFENDDHELYELERLYASGKGSKLGTLTVKRNNQVVPENVFFDQIKNINGGFYADSFIFNQDMLAKVGQIQQSDLLERIYYLGAANSDKLLDLRDYFAKNAGSLFKKAGKNPPVNQLLKQVQDQENHVRASENEFALYQDLSKDYKEQKEALNKQEQKQLELQTKYNDLEKIQKLIPSYEKLQHLKQQAKPIAFDSEQYQSAQTLTMQIENLRKKQEKIAAKLSEFRQNQNDDSNEKDLIQKKPEVLQWQTEYHNCIQKEAQIKNDEKQLLTLDPNLKQIAGFSQEQILKLQDDYRNLPDDQTKNEAADNSKPNPVMLIGIAAVVLGIVLLFIARAFGLLALALGALLLLSGYFQQKQQKNSDQAQRIQKVRQKRQAFENYYHVNLAHFDINSLINDWRQYQVQQQKLESTLVRKKEVHNELADLAAQVSQIIGQNVAVDFNSVLAALDQLSKKLEVARSQREEQISLENNLAESKEELHDSNIKLKMIFARAHVADFNEYQQIKDQSEEQKEIARQIAVLKSNLQDDLNQLEDFTKDKEKSTQKLSKLTEELSLIQKDIQQTQSAIAEIKVKMTALANSTVVFAEKQKLANLRTSLKNLSADYLSDLVVSKWIARALDLASNERFPKMLITAKEYLRLLTNNRYNDIDIDKKLTVTRFDGKKIKVQYLSRGTSEQLYFALKLAFVQQIKDQINLPILIDDSFVNFDDTRVDEINKLLHKIAQNNQVMIFTAQTSLVDKLQLKPLTLTKGTQNV